MIERELEADACEAAILAALATEIRERFTCPEHILSTPEHNCRFWGVFRAEEADRTGSRIFQHFSALSST